MNGSRVAVLIVYTVVGCSECSALWIVEDRPDRTECPRCGRSSQFQGLRHLYRDDDVAAARRARSRLLAERTGGDIDDWAAIAGDALDLDDVGVDDADYLAASGLDVEAVQEAGDRAGSTTSTDARSRRAVILAAISDLEDPTESAIVSAAAENGIGPERARTVLDRLHDRGLVAREEGRYRRI